MRFVALGSHHLRGVSEPETDELLVLGDMRLRSRLLVGTGKYASFEETARALEISATHIEARLALRAPALLDFLISNADSPELLPTDQIGPYLLRHLHTRDDLKADEQAQIASYGNNLALWQLGLVKLLLKFHSITRIRSFRAIKGL